MTKKPRNTGATGKATRARKAAQGATRAPKADQRAGTADTAVDVTAAPRSRTDSKQAKLIKMLRQANGEISLFERAQNRKQLLFIQGFEIRRQPSARRDSRGRVAGARIPIGLATSMISIPVPIPIPIPFRLCRLSSLGFHESSPAEGVVGNNERNRIAGARDICLPGNFRFSERHDPTSCKKNPFFYSSRSPHHAADPLPPASCP